MCREDLSGVLWGVCEVVLKGDWEEGDPALPFGSKQGTGRGARGDAAAVDFRAVSR